MPLIDSGGMFQGGAVTGSQSRSYSVYRLTPIWLDLHPRIVVTRAFRQIGGMPRRQGRHGQSVRAGAKPGTFVG